MAIRLLDVDAADSGLFGEWYFRTRPIFMQSPAFEILKRELAAYVRGDVLGRSFLIAAHRGVGKTSLVLRAVADLQRTAIKDVAKPGMGSAATPHSGSEPRRPLLVKLSGSALLPQTPANDGATGPPVGESALAQLTIALYRALARETAEGFTLHAREIDLRRIERGRRGSDLPELAAQLTLDLDLAPELALLRAGWDRLGRLGSGVIWPQQVADQGRTDRGLREIVALATANQAFRECVGQISSSKSDKDTDQAEHTTQGGVALDLKETVNKLWSLGAGALVGGALLHGSQTLQGAAVAAAGGGVAAVVSTFAFSWSASRTRKSERNADYTFIVNHSLQTLERDLPVVIDRIRDAGLAPVFLIDEMDKLDAPDVCIREIIGRLKSLTTDYGFFCFLTDRDYYDGLEQKLRSEAFPVEHTFFSHRLLIMYRPAELARYVRQLWMIDETQPQEAQAAWIVTCVVLHRARLNSQDIRREIARFCTADGALRPRVNDICTQAEYLLPMVVQLAIEHVLRSRDIRRRVQDDDAFAQLALDVLYMISRAWHEGGTVTIDPDTVRDDLIRRRCLPGSPEEARDQLRLTVSDDDLRILTQKATRLATLLTSFASIRAAILEEDAFKTLPAPAPLPPAADVHESERAKIATLAPLLLGIPGASAGLLAATDQSCTFRFLFNRYGVEHPEISDEARLLLVQDAIAFFDEFVAAVSDAQLSVSALVSAGVLPASLDEAVLTETANRLRGSQSIDVLAAIPDADLAQLTGFPTTAQTLSRAVVGIVALASLILDHAIAVNVPLTSDGALAIIDQLLGLVPLTAVMSQPQSAAASRVALKSPGSPVIDAVLEIAPGVYRPGDRWWRRAIAAARARLETALIPKATVEAENWQDLWRLRVAAWVLDHSATGAPPIVWADIAAAARGEPLTALLRPDLETMSAADWSRFCMAMFPHRQDPRLGWAFTAGLRALGFGIAVLQAAGDSQFAAGAVERPPAVLYIHSGDGEFGGPPDPESGPILVVPKAQRADYAGIVRWLSEHEALTAKSA